MKCTFDILVLGFFHRKLCCSSLQSFTRWHSAIPSDECSSAVRKKQSKIQVTIVVRYSAQWTWEYTKLDGYVLHSSWAAVCCCVSCCCCNSPSASNFLKAVELILFPVASSGTSSTTIGSTWTSRSGLIDCKWKEWVLKAAASWYLLTWMLQYVLPPQKKKVLPPSKKTSRPRNFSIN